jgi:hypothetical protein
VTVWNKAHPPFSRRLSTAERAVFIGALWRAEKRVEQVFRRPNRSFLRTDTPTSPRRRRRSRPTGTPSRLAYRWKRSSAKEAGCARRRPRAQHAMRLPWPDTGGIPREAPTRCRKSRALIGAFSFRTTCVSSYVRWVWSTLWSSQTFGAALEPSRTANSVTDVSAFGFIRRSLARFASSSVHRPPLAGWLPRPAGSRRFARPDGARRRRTAPPIVIRMARAWRAPMS